MISTFGLNNIRDVLFIIYHFYIDFLSTVYLTSQPPIRADQGVDVNKQGFSHLSSQSTIHNTNIRLGNGIFLPCMYGLLHDLCLCMHVIFARKSSSFRRD